MYYIASIAVVVGLLAISAWGLAYWSTHPLRVPVPRHPPPDVGVPEDVSFRTSDGLTLSGWYFATPNARAVLVLCHGHQFHRCQMLDVMRGLKDGPFSFLLFDFRCAGRSEGKLSTIGADEVRDLEAAVEWLKSRPDTHSLPIGVFGYSMGGAVAIMAAAHDDRIEAVATQGAYASLDRAIADRGRFFIGRLGPLLAQPALLLGKRWLGQDPASVAPVGAVADIAPRPVMIFHGEWDPFISPDDGRLIYVAAREPKRLRILKRSWHIGVDARERPAYHAELRRFFEGALLGPGRLRPEPEAR
ncbi:MAG: alpha/beta hydrolase [Armatimonadetes bacterium]|nr:alpha/beta hydrolase [Armatimonadota bacterium]